MMSNHPVPSVSLCQKAMKRLSLLQRNPSRQSNSSSYTQSKVPLTIVSLPSVVRGMGAVASMVQGSK